MVSLEEKLKEYVVIWQFEFFLMLSFEQIFVFNFQLDFYNGVNENEFLLVFRILFLEFIYVYWYKYGDFFVIIGGL